MRAAEQDRPDVKRARTLWRRQQGDWDVRRLVFIDEMSLNTKLARLYGRSPRGQRCLSAVPHGHWRSSTFLAALTHQQVAAPFLVEGPVDAEVFTVYLQSVLAPCLRPGDTLILDNLATHKIQRVESILADCGVALRYLPPYSPDLNPIELAFAKLKAQLRQAAARTLDELQSAVASSLNTFSASDCSAFFRHAKYKSI
jgi:transposase